QAILSGVGRPGTPYQPPPPPPPPPPPDEPPPPDPEELPGAVAAAAIAEPRELPIAEENAPMRDELKREPRYHDGRYALPSSSRRANWSAKRSAQRFSTSRASA